MSADLRSNHPQYENLASENASSMTWNILFLRGKLLNSAGGLELGIARKIVVSGGRTEEEKRPFSVLVFNRNFQAQIVL